MGYIVVMIVLFAFMIVGFVSGSIVRSVGKTDNSEHEALGSLIRWGSIGAFAFIFALSTVLSVVHQVPAGHVGVVYTFGDITGQTEEGLVTTWPWQRLIKATVQVQTLAFVDEDSKVPEGGKIVGEGLDSFSEETQNVFIDAILRIKVSPDNVQGLYTDVGENYINKLIPGSIAQVFKDETVNYKAVDIAPSREVIRRNVEQAIRNELSRFSIDVDALLIENISFAEEFEAAIQAKQNATQEALKENELVAAETAKADQRIESARGVAEKLKIEAAGQAEANRLLNESLTPLLIQFQAVQKLADDLTIALIPAGEGVIIDPTTLLAPIVTE